MDPQADFKEIEIPGFLDLMALTRSIGPTSRNLLKVAFEHGGYVAGGFGTVIARYYTGILEGTDELDNAIRRHLGDPSTSRTGLFANAGCGDIDVWFPDQKSYAAFAGDLRGYPGGIGIKETITGNAEERLIENDARFQFVRGYLAPMREQIAKFDIYNGSVAFNDKLLIIPEHFEALERAHTLHVSTWASSWTMNRFFKWVNRKRWYERATPATSQHIYEQVMKIVEWKKKYAGTAVMDDSRIMEAITNDKLKKRIMLHGGRRLQRFLGPAITGLTGEQLLEVSAFFPAPLKYDFAMQEIHRRMPVT